MTGIFCYHSKDNALKNESLDLLNTNFFSLNHRGNQITQQYKEHNWFLGVFTNEAQIPNNYTALFQARFDERPYFCVIDGQISNKDEIMAIVSKRGYKANTINEAVYHGFKTLGMSFFKSIQGMFSIVLGNSEELVAVKDPIGFNPLYVVKSDDYIVLSSELKALKGIDGNVNFLKPGTILHYNKGHESIKYWHTIDHFEQLNRMNSNFDELKETLRNTLETSVKASLKANGKVCALLSGGIDSSVICALAQKHLDDLEVYTIIADKSPDLEHAKNLVKMYPKLNHNLFKVGIDELLGIVRDVIYHLETFDAALIRSALPMYYICSKVDSDCSVLLTGEGGDELFGGYEYLKDLTTTELNNEFKELLAVEHATGLQRVDRIPYAFGFEARAPWFDYNLVRFSFQVPIQYKLFQQNGRVIEKYIIKEAFREILPSSIYERKKAKFSKGVGTQFLLRDYFNKKISDDEFASSQEILDGVVVKNKEELYYWKIFKDLFDPNSGFIKKLPRTSVFIT